MVQSASVLCRGSGWESIQSPESSVPNPGSASHPTFYMREMFNISHSSGVSKIPGGVASHPFVRNRANICCRGALIKANDYVSGSGVWLARQKLRNSGANAYLWVRSGNEDTELLFRIPSGLKSQRQRNGIGAKTQTFNEQQRQAGWLILSLIVRISASCGIIVSLG